MRITGKFLFATAVAAVGSGFQHGYNTGVINIPRDIIESWFSLVYDDRSNSKKSKEFIKTIFILTASIYCVGGIFGGLCTSLFASRIGRRNGLFFNNLFAIVAAILMGFSKAAQLPEMLIIGRFFSGFNCGLNSGLAPMYLVEISPKEIRGAVGTVYSLVLTVALLLSQVLGLRTCLGTEKLWPILFGLVGLMAALQIVLLPFCPESPRYLLVNKGDNDFQDALYWLRTGDVDEPEEDEDDEIEEEFYEIETETDLEGENFNFASMFTQKYLLVPLNRSLILMLAQQLSGISAILFYSTSILVKVGFERDIAKGATVCFGVLCIVMTIISLLLVDRVGRKTLMLDGLGLMAFYTIVLAVILIFAPRSSYFILAAVLVVFIAVSFTIGPGSIPWFYFCEVFTQKGRSFAGGLVLAANWSANFVVVFSFLSLHEMMNEYVFFIFAVFQILFFVIIFLLVPDTTNKTYQEIMEEFEDID